MTVGFLKRLLTLINLAAVLVIAGTAYGFLSHRSYMSERWNPPDFVVPVEVKRYQDSRIDNTIIPLGSVPTEVDTQPGPVEDKGPEPIETALDKLGEIRGAVVAYEPYGDAKPAIIFQYKEAPPGLKPGDVLTIRVGEALVTAPHPDPQLREWGDRVNLKYKFVRCEPDPDNPGWTFFVFDTDCDGKTFQKARWKGESQATGLPAAKAADDTPEATDLVRPVGWRPKRPEPGKVTTEPVQPGTATPEPVRPRERVTELRGPIFERDRGTFEATDEGIAYLRDNHEKILKEAYTQPYRGKDGRVQGIKIRAIKAKSVANEFGIREGDVIVKVNRQPVRSKAEAINVVKKELNRKVRYIEVEVLRLGATKILRFDSRDPAARRAARDFRNR